MSLLLSVAEYGLVFKPLNRLSLLTGLTQFWEKCANRQLRHSFEHACAS